MRNLSPFATLIGTVLAGVLLPDGQHALLAFLARGEHGGETVELCTWDITKAGKLVHPAKPPLMVPLADLDQLRTLVENVVAALAAMHPVQDEAVGLTCDNDGALTATVAANADGTSWVTLGLSGAQGLVSVPTASIASLVGVLAEAERVLAELGRLPLPHVPRS